MNTPTSLAQMGGIHSVAWAAVALTPALWGCDVGPTEPEFRTVDARISFTLNGHRIESRFPDLGAGGNAAIPGFTVYASDYASGGFGSLEISTEGVRDERDGWTLGAASGSHGELSLTPEAASLAGVTFGALSTRSGGAGRLSVESGPTCHGVSGTDPFTGSQGTWTFCNVEVSFEFRATNGAGDVVEVRDGRLRATLQRR